MKILCYLNHFYGKSLYFEGKSSTQESSVRKEIIEKCIAQLANIKGVEIKICGIEGHSLVKPDIDFSNIKNNPTLLIYESLNHMVNFLDSYDYFINIEDDIYLPEETFNNVVEFDKTAFLNEVLHPNRHETDDNGNKYCVDILALDSWTFQRRRYHGIELRVALNPHSGILILSREKLRYAISQIDLNFRGVILSAAMESAFAHFHSPFALYRVYNNLDFHYIIHLDKWIPTFQKEASKEDVEEKFENSDNLSLYGERQKETKMIRYKFRWTDFIPPIMVKIRHSLIEKTVA